MSFELIWADVKNWIAANYIHKEVIKPFNRNFSFIKPELWIPKIKIEMLEIGK